MKTPKPALTPISGLVPDPANRRQHNPRNLGMITEALAAVGTGRSIVIDEDNVVLAGNGVVEAAVQAGITQVHVIETEGDALVAVRRRGLTADQKRALAIYDNRTAELAEWNAEQLQADMAAGLDLQPWFSDEELTKIVGPSVKPGLTEPDAVPDLRPTSIQRGDLFRLGAHRLLCGDSTDRNDVARLIAGPGALVLTDAPYGIEIVTGSKVGGGGALHFGTVVGVGWVDSRTYARVTNDDSTATARQFYITLAAFACRGFILWGGNYFADFLPPSSCWLVWDKQNTGNFADVELAWTSFPKAAKLYQWMWNGLARAGDRVTEGLTRVHPTQKPVGLHVSILNDWTELNDYVFDGFCGSGTVLIACEQTRRQCLAIECESSYCQVIIDRWEAFTGQKAEKLGEVVHA